MSRTYPTAIAIAMAVTFCSPAVVSTALAAGPDKLNSPAKSEPVPGTSLKKLTLTEKAAQRLDIRIAEISQDTAGRKIAPFPALVYDLKGEAWVYTNPSPLTYVRHKIVVEQVKGEQIILVDGPPQGTKVVIMGVAELYGTERGLGY